MRKPLVLIMIVLLCFSMLQFGHLISLSSQSSSNAQDVSNSVVQNGGFEQGLTGWTHNGDGFLGVTSDNPHSGNYSLEISSSVIQQAYCYQHIDFPNASFVFSFWVFRVDQDSHTAFYLGREWDGNTITIVSSLVIQNDKIWLDAWDNPYAPGQQEFNYDVAVGVWHNVTFLANATLGTQGFYIDGNLIENLNSSSGNVFNPDILIFGDVNTVACHGHFYFDDFALTALGPALGVSDSVVQNGGFEQGLTGWTHGGDGFLGVTSDNPHSGNYTMKISSSISQQAYFYQYVTFPNASFVFSFWIFRVDQNSETHCYLDRDWDGNTARVVSSLVIKDDTIGLQAWDNPYAPGRQIFNYTVTIGVWHNVTFLANATLGTQDFYIDGNLIETIKSSSGNVFNPDMLCFGDVSNGACNGTFYFDDIALNALGTAITTPPPPPPPPPPQGNGAVIRIEPENVTVKKDDVFTVNVTIENVSASPGIAGIQFTITWDPAILTALNLTDVVFHEVTPPAEYDNIWQLQNTISLGQAKYAYTWQDAVRAQAGGYLPISGNHTVATIAFKAVNEGVTTLQFSALKVAGPNAEQLNVASPAIASTVNVVDCMLADINSDGKVDLYDALIMANHFGCRIGDANWNGSADMNNDGQIDIYDVIILAAVFKV